MNHCYNCAILMCVCKNDNINYIESAHKSIVDADWSSLSYHIFIHVDGPINAEVSLYLKNVKNTTVYYSKESKGLAYGLNLLLSKKINADYFFRMDADDICVKDRFVKQFNFMESNPNVSILGGAITEFCDQPYYSFVRHYPLYHERIISNFHKGSQIAHVTTCTRSNVFNIISYNSNNKLNEDLELWYSAICSNFKFANLPDVLVEVRLNNNFFLRRGYVKAFKEFFIMIKICYKVAPFSLKYTFPFAKLLFRFLPYYIIRLLYRSKLRNIIISNIH